MEKKFYLANAFSLQMVDKNSIIITRPSEAAEVPLNAVSCIGHADTAAVLSTILGREVEVNRTSIHLNKGDVLYVAQVMGGRLPEGATTLPDGFRIEFIRVEMFGHSI